jgi:hypothetical protein
MFRSALPALALALLTGCTSQSAQEPDYTVSLGSSTYTVELATTPEQRARGLMHRESLPSDAGMLFVYPAELAGVEFWMKNTLIPLDILYFDKTQHLTQIYAETPPCVADPCPTYGAAQPTQYILELPSGAAARDGVTIDTYLQINFPLPDAK